MSMIPPFAVGESTTSAQVAGDLGKTYRIGAGTYRVVKTANSLAAPGSKALQTAMSAGVPTWVVDTTATANAINMAGIVPAAYTATLAANTYILIQVKGPGSVLSNVTTIFATYTASPTLVSSTAAGSVLGASTAIDPQEGFRTFIGWCTNTAAVTAAGLAITCIVDIPGV